MALGDTVVSSWLCNENAANTSVVDGAASNDFTASTNTSNLSVAGHIDRAFDFNGTTELLTRTALTEIDVTKNYSVVFWFKADSISANQTIFNSGTGTANRLTIGFTDSANNIGVRSFVSGNDTHEKTAFSDTASQHLFILSHNSDNTITWYIDNVAQTDTGAGNITTTATAGTAVGALTGPGQFFDGQISDIVLFDSAIDATLAGELWNSGAGLAYPYAAAGGAGSPSIIGDGVF